jgi:hypothetical protein
MASGIYGVIISYPTAAGLGGSIDGAGGGNSGDPTTAINLSGRYYIGYINANSGQSVAYSTDNGVTWTQVVAANKPPGSGSLLDKNHLWVDNGPLSPYAGQLYDACTPFGGTNDSKIEIMRSTNNDVSWENKLAISDGVAAGAFNHGVIIGTEPPGRCVAW